MEKSDKDKMFDDFQQRGLDELQKFFDGGGKLDFSEVGSVDEIADLVRSGFEKISDDPLTFRTDYKNISETPDFDLKKIDDFKNNYSAKPWTHKRNEHFDYPSDFFEHPFYPEYEKWLAEEIEAGRLPLPWSDVVKMSDAGKRGAADGQKLRNELIDKNGNEHMPYQRIIEKPIYMTVGEDIGRGQRRWKALSLDDDVNYNFDNSVWPPADNCRRWWKPWTWPVWGWLRGLL